MTFFVTLFSTILVVCGKVNFTNLSRYSELNEKTYRRHFTAEFDFTSFNVIAIAEYGRIDKTLHTLTYIDDEVKRRDTLTQLNRGEGRHSVARTVFHGKCGELRQHYREGQEDQLGALGLVLNMIVL